MNVEIDSSANEPLIRISGRATVEKMASLREQLLPFLREGRTLNMDLTAVDRADVTFLQLLVALSNSARALGMQINIVPGGISEAVLEAGRSGGFIGQEPNGKAVDLWTLFYSRYTDAGEQG
jgi:ABC-type transporter Mla MlaB component